MKDFIILTYLNETRFVISKSEIIHVEEGAEYSFLTLRRKINVKKKSQFTDSITVKEKLDEIVKQLVQ